MCGSSVRYKAQSKCLGPSSAAIIENHTLGNLSQTEIYWLIILVAGRSKIKRAASTETHLAMEDGRAKEGKKESMTHTYSQDWEITSARMAFDHS